METIPKGAIGRVQINQNYEGSAKEQTAYVTTVKSESSENPISKLLFGTAEESFAVSSYYSDSQFRPYNPDDLVQKNTTYSYYEDMLKDDQVSVCLNIKKDLVLGSGFEIVTTVDDDLNKEIKKDLEKTLNEDVEIPFLTQLEDILTAYEFGFSLSEKVFKYRDDGKLTLKYSKTRHPSTWLIHTDDYGNVIKYEQQGVDRSVSLDSRSLIHYINNQRFYNPYGKSDLRAAYNAWFIKKQIIKYYAIFMEKAASPIPVAKYNKNAPQAAVDAIYDAIRRFQTKTALAIPKEIEVEFLKSNNNGDVFTKGINIFNMFIGRSLLIPDLLGFQGSETAGGSYSLGKDQIKIMLKHIQRRKEQLESLVNHHYIKPLVTYNYGYLEDCPKFRLKETNDEQNVELAKLWIELAKGRLYKPTIQEINYFRSVVKFPLSEDLGEIEPIETKQPEIAGDDKVIVSKFARGPYKFPTGDYHKKVNFKVIEASLDSYRDAILNESAPVVTQIFEDLFDQIEQKKILKNQDAAKIELIELKYLKQLKLILKKNFREVYKDAELAAQNEILKGNYGKTPLANEDFLEFLENESFLYVGDWAYNIKKSLKVKLIQAVKDGIPLSSVIDDLGSEDMEDALISIERYSRTKLTEVYNRGRLSFFEKSGVVAAYQYSAILDSVTTDICEGLDGKVFESGDQPIPPLHFNCRSVLIPITKYEEYEADTKVGKTPIDKFIEDNRGDGFSKQ